MSEYDYEEVENQQYHSPNQYHNQYHHESSTNQTQAHENLGNYANTDLDQDFDKCDIKIGIVGREVRGSALSKYTVYLIKGQDKNGEINVGRRFNEFHEMRNAMVKRWPGCFIPSIPSKNFIKKNDEELTIKRERYLNDYLKKVSKLSYLYYSEEFQALIRSKQSDISVIFSKWPPPTNESIILRYKECFSELAGLEINPSTNNKITEFNIFLTKNVNLLEKYREMAKQLAESRDRLDQNYNKFFTQIFPNYQKTCLFEYVDGKQESLLYHNSNQAKLAQHAAIFNSVSQKNPYWLLYDLIKHEERDGRAFLQTLGIPQIMERQKQQIQVKIKQNQKSIVQISSGKKNFASITSKGSNEEIKYKLEMQNESLKKQKQNIYILSDIISALIAYIEIAKYKAVKAKFYEHTLRKLGGYQINLVQNCAQIWKATGISVRKHE